MKTQELKYVTRRRAAVLLGLSEMELSRISSESGFGHREVAGEQEETCPGSLPPAIRGLSFR